VHAARLGLGDQVAATMKASTNSFQVYPTGLAAWNTGQPAGALRRALGGVTALAINETLAADYGRAAADRAR